MLIPIASGSVQVRSPYVIEHDILYCFHDVWRFKKNWLGDYIKTAQERKSLEYQM